MAFTSGLVSTVGALCFVAFGVSAAVMEQHWHDHDYITDSFIDIALRREYDNNKNLDMIRKWRKPIRVFVQSDAGNSTLQKEMVGVQLNHLASITRHRIGFVKSAKEANVHVVFILKRNMVSSIKKRGLWNDGSDKILADAACLANVTSTNRGGIIGATIHIPVDSTRSSGLFLNCVVEEITQVMGLMNDSSKVFPSIFNDKSIDGYLSGLDYILLKILYHPKMIKGLKEAQVRKVILKILAELDENESIVNASVRVLPNSMLAWVES